MKKTMCLALIICILFSTFVYSVSAQNNMTDAWDIMVMVNGKRVVQDSNGVALIIKTSWIGQSAVNLAPVRAICEALGANINWNNESQTVTVYNDIAAIALQTNNKLITIGRKTLAGDYSNTVTEQIMAEPVNIGGTVYIPIRAVAEGLGATVEWVQEEKLIKINSASQPQTPNTVPVMH